MDAVDHLVNNAGLNSIAMLEEVPDVTILRPVMVSIVALLFGCTLLLVYNSNIILFHTLKLL